MISIFCSTKKHNNSFSSFLFLLWNASEAVVQRCSVKKGVPRNFEKFTGKHLCQSLFFNKFPGLFFNKVEVIRSATLLKKRLWHRCFPGNFLKFLRTPFFTEHIWWMFLTLAVCWELPVSNIVMKLNAVCNEIEPNDIVEKCLVAIKMG